MPLDLKWLNQDPSSPGFVDAARILYGSQGRTLSEILSDLTFHGVLGLGVTYAGNGYVTVAPGLIVLDGQRLQLSQPRNVHIAYDQRDGGTPTNGVVYYLYAFIDVQDQLDFYFSDQAPTIDIGGNTVVHDEYSKLRPCFHPVDMLTSRCIGQVYCTGSASIAAFERCGCGWCVSPWTSLPGNSRSVSVRHGLGFRPVFVDVSFSTSIDGSGVVPPLSKFFTSGWFGQVGVRCSGVDASSFTLYQLANGAFMNTGGNAQSSGFFQLKFNT